MAEGPTSEWITNQGKVFLSVSEPKRMREPEARQKLQIAHHDRDGINRLEAIEAITAHIPPLLDAAVIRAHKQGRSWAEIGEALGVSAQGAHKKFAERLGLTE